jgi:hypothetical protein
VLWDGGSGIPAPAPTIAVPESICLRKVDRISFLFVGGAIFGEFTWYEMQMISTDILAEVTLPTSLR